MLKVSELKKEIAKEFNLDVKDIHHISDKRKDGSKKVKMFFGSYYLESLENEKRYFDKTESIREYLINRGIEVKEGYGDISHVWVYGLVFYLK